MPLVAQLADAGVELLDLLRVHAGGRLVEQHQRGLGGKRARKFEPPLLAEGEVGGKLVALVREAEELERAVDARARALREPPNQRAHGSSRLPLRGREFCATHRFCQTVSCPNRRMFWKVRAMPMRDARVRRQLGDVRAVEA